MNGNEAIQRVEQLLPGEAPADDESPVPDARWRAIIQLGTYIESEPEEIWEFISRWGPDPPDEDLRSAIATCLLEHLLEFHFAKYFPRIKKLALKSCGFRKTFCYCWRFGQADRSPNKERFDALKQKCGCTSDL